MNKKKIIYVFFLIIIASLLIIFIYNNKQNKNVNILAITVDGLTVDDMPSGKNYKVTPTCSNANGSWDYSSWQLKLANVTDNVICTLAFETINTNTNNIYTYLTTNDIDVESDGYSTLTQDTNTGSYRYIGANPSNYVLFNGERWQIIGFFDSRFHGQTDKTLAKIIRSESIGGYSYDTSTSIDIENYSFADSSIYTLLNNAYLNAQDVSGAANGCSQGFYASANETTCNFSTIGLNSISRDMIVNANWYILDHDYFDYRSDAAYGDMAEFSDMCDNPDTGECTTLTGYDPDIVTGYVGLPSLSDYFNTMGDDPTSLGINQYYTNSTPAQLIDYSYYDCSWLMNSSPIWLINYSFVNSTTDAYSTFDDGSSNSVISLMQMHSSSGVKPTVYLDENVLIVSGTGTYDDPYIITK